MLMYELTVRLLKEYDEELIRESLGTSKPSELLPCLIKRKEEMTLREMAAKRKADKKAREVSDIRSDMEVLSKMLYSQLDPSIRSKLQRRGISVIQNVYAGFDTEYQNIDTKTNKLLSVQLAINTRTLLKLPITTPYRLSTMNSQTKETYPQKPQDMKSFDYGLLELSIDDSIKSIRKAKYYRADEAMRLLSDGVRSFKGSDYYEIEDSLIVRLARTPMETYINIVGSEGYKLTDLVSEINERGDPYLTRAYEYVMRVMKELSEGVSDPEESAVEKEGYKAIGEELERLGHKRDIKSRSRAYASYQTSRVSVSRIKTVYLTAHLSHADLSMLSDFEEFKDQLSVVNKTFVTLGKPMQINGTSIVVRDTMHLAPGGKKSLDAIGSLYKGPGKVNLTKEQKGNMELVLSTDRALFTEYAMRDAEITLMHSNYMDDFNFGLKGIGVPITLSNLGYRFVKSF